MPAPIDGESLKATLDMLGKGGEPGYMLFDNRTGATGRDGLGATDQLTIYSSDIDDIEAFLRDIGEQVLSRERRIIEGK